MKIKEIKPYEGWLKTRFGDCYAQISTNTMLRVKSSIKDVHRVLHGRVPPEIEILCKKIPMPPQGIEDSAFVFGYEDSNGDWVKGIVETDPAMMEYVQKYPKEWSIVQKCLGLVRGKSRHACGFAIMNEPIKTVIPLATIGGVKITQYISSDVEEAGGLKMDFLVVNSLNDIAGAIKLIQKRNNYQPKTERLNGVDVPGLRVVPYMGALYDIWALPEDQAVFRDICYGKTETVFQFGTPGAKQWLSEFVTSEGEHTLKSINDLATFTALDRPGPLDAFVEDGDTQRNMLQEFAARSRGEDPIGPMAILDKLCAKTYGIICFQEQLQKVFQEVGGTTGIQANQFRDDIGKKRMKAVMAWKEVFMPGAIEKLGEAEAQRLWDQMETFGQYGFNASHAVCYVVIGYACAWLKHHFPLEWWTAVLSNATKKEIEEKFWAYCGTMIDMPDVKLSGDGFEIQGDRIRAPMWLMDGLGPVAHQEICSERPYTDVQDFCNKIYQRRVRLATKTDKGKLKLGRTALNKTIMAKMIISGTLDSLFPSGTSVQDKFQMYAEAKRVASGAKKIEPLDEKYANLLPIQRFQLKKMVLPTFGEDLLRYVRRLNPLPNYFIDRGDFIDRGERCYFKTKRPLVSNYSDEPNYEFRFLNGADLNLLLSKIVENPPPTKTAAIAYVNEIKRFKYAGGRKEACKITLEVDSHRFTLVKWPKKVRGEDFDRLDVPDGLETGAIIAVTFLQFSEGKDFSIDDIEVVSPPLTLSDKEEESST